MKNIVAIGNDGGVNLCTSQVLPTRRLPFAVCRCRLPATATATAIKATTIAFGRAATAATAATEAAAAQPPQPRDRKIIFTTQ